MNMEIMIPGYQDLAIESNANGFFLYMGGDFVFMTPEQWETFKSAVNDATVRHVCIEQPCSVCGSDDGMLT